jgi:hypothetical protein
VGGTYSTHGGKIIANTVLVGQSEGKRPSGRTRSRTDDTIKMAFKK